MPNPMYTTLTANTVATVTLDALCAYVRVEYVSGSANVYFTVDGSTPDTTPSDGQHFLPVVVGGKRQVRTINGVDAPVVKLKSTGTPTLAIYRVTDPSESTFS